MLSGRRRLTLAPLAFNATSRQRLSLGTQTITASLPSRESSSSCSRFSCLGSSVEDGEEGSRLEAFPVRASGAFPGPVKEAKQAQTALENALRAHPNHPSFDTSIVPSIPRDALDDDVCYESEEEEAARGSGDCSDLLGMGNLLSLRWANVWLYRFGVAVVEAKQAQTALQEALRAHPNHPNFDTYIRPYIPRDALDDDVLSDPDEEDALDEEEE